MEDKKVNDRLAFEDELQINGFTSDTVGHGPMLINL